jgi:flagellin
MLQRMRELAVQSSNGTYSSAQRLYLNTEFDQLLEQIENIATETTWNGMTLLDNAAATGLSTTSGIFTFQVGQNADETIAVTIDAMDKAGLTVSGLGVDTASGASSAIDTIDVALDIINEQRATIGAAINQLTYASDNLTNISSNITASRSSIMDTDYASASTQLSKTQIIQQAATAMLAQANQQPQSVLALLK